MNVELISGDARRLPLADESVQCIVTSPPYWGLRKYAGQQQLIWRSPQFLSALDCAHEWGLMERVKRKDILPEDATSLVARIGTDERQNGAGTNGGRFCIHCGAWRGDYGLEPTVEMYVAHTVEILRELRRVLRKDGVLFWNLGDCYYQGSNGNSGELRFSDKQSTNVGSFPTRRGVDIGPNRKAGASPTLKAKDLVLMPARVALAVQADGWWVRSAIVWAKPNPMPESVTDRPTDAYEYILMLTRSARYFWDAYAVREPASENTHSRGNGDGGPKARERTNERNHNVRNVWEFAIQPYSGAHFATFPEELPRRCILAATSAIGACRFCGAPWERISETTVENQSGSARAGNVAVGKMAGGTQVRDDHDIRLGPCVESRTVGWSPTCRCRGQQGRTVPCVVLDPFAGSGTTGRVAIELNRRAVLVDLAYARADHEKGRDYASLTRERITNVQRVLPL